MRMPKAPHLAAGFQPLPESRMRTIAPHWHQYSELLVVFAGHATHLTQHFRAALHAGSAALVPFGVSHAITECAGLLVSTVAYRADWILADTAVLMREGDLPPGFYAVGRPMDDSHGVWQTELQSAEMQLARSEIESLGKEAERERPSVAFLHACLLKLLVAFGRACRRNTQLQPQRRFPTHIWTAVERIETLLAHSEPFSVAGVADDLGISPEHFSRLFKRCTGMGPKEYYQERRIEYARQMLFDPAVSITEIAFRLGFANGSHLAQSFKRNTGLTPQAFRRQCTGQ